MSDDRSRSIDADESADVDAGSENEPGGGPRRVVSDRSVDDILASLDETDPADAADTEETTGTADELEATEDDASVDPPQTDDSPTASFDEDDLLETADESASDDEAGAPSTADTDPATESTTTADSTADELEARIERGEVTGADVRAAESGGGREATPDVDEIELSMDDLERTGSGGPSETASAGSAVRHEGSSDPAPIRDGTDSAGRDDIAGKPGVEDGSASEDESGLLGRIKRFFSG